MWRWSRARSSCMPCATAGSLPSANGDPSPDDSGRKVFDVWSPKLGLLWNVDPFWQVFANVSRSAEVPSFGENTFTVQRLLRCQGSRSPPPTRSAPAAARPTSPGTSRPTAPRSRTSCSASMRASASAPARAQCSTAPCTRASRSASAPRVLKSMFVPGARPDKLWLNLAYTFNDFRFDDDARVRRQRAAGRAAPLPARRAALQASDGVVRRTQRRVGAGGLLCRQRQHHQDRALHPARRQARLRQRRAVLGLHRGAAT